MFPPQSKKTKQPMHYNDMVYEILAMLPVKTLMRFKAVCKSWYSLISFFQFKEHHHSLTPYTPLLLKIHHLDDEEGEPDPYALQLSTCNPIGGTLVKNFSKDFRQPFRSIVFECNYSNCIQSCRGLVCLASTLFDSIVICNPSTEEIKLLPLSEGDACCIGFGYAAIIEKFKVVRLFSLNNRFRCVVLTVGSDQWREVSADPYHIDDYHWGLGRAPFLNGALHFLPIHPDSERENECISVFDVESEVFSKMSLPDHRLEDFSTRHLSVLQGSLCLTVTFVSIVFGEYTTLVELWILKNYENVEWEKKYEITAFSRNDGLIDPLEIIQDKIIMLNVLEKGTELIRYCPLSGTITEKLDQDCSATIFVESLFTPEGA